MNKIPVNASGNEGKGKPKEDVDKRTDEENTRNKDKSGKRGDKGGAVLGEINDD